MTDAAQVKTMNTALAQLGKPLVSDLSEASLRQNAAAMKLLALMDDARDVVLRRHGWLSALAYACLQPAKIPNDGNWKYCARYLLPAGALRVWEVRTPVEWVPFQEIDWISFGMVGPPIIEGERWEQNTIDTDQGARVIVRSDITCGLALSYVRTCSYSAMDIHLRDAIGFTLAARGAMTVTGDGSQQASLEKKAEEKALMAVSTDGTQEGGQYPIAPSIPARIRAMSR